MLLFWVPFAAQPALQWQTTYGGSDQEVGTTVIETTDGGYLVVARTFSNDGDVPNMQGVADYYVVKLDSMGELVWQKTFGGSNHDWPYAAVETPDDGYVVVGYSRSLDGDVIGGHGDRDAWVIKLDKQGDLLWQKALGGSGWDEAWSVDHASNGGIIIAGRSNSSDGDAAGNSGGSLDYWVIKLNDEGEVEWQRTYGGSEEDSATFIKQATDGGYLISGETKSTDGDVTGNNGNVDIWVIKIDHVGNLEWQNALGGAGLDSGRGIFEISDAFIGSGHVSSYNSGDVSGSQGQFDFWVFRLDLNGNLVWQKTMGGSGPDWLQSGSLTPEGNLVVAGNIRSVDGDILLNHGQDDIWLIEFNPNGEVLWQKSLGGVSWDVCYHVEATADGGYALTGTTWSTDGDVSGSEHKGSGDLWIVKLAPESTPTSSLTTAPLSLFPNPAQQTTTLTVPAEYDVLHVEITDLPGRLLSVQQILNGENMNLQALHPGVYFVTAVAADGQRFVGKLLKE